MSDAYIYAAGVAACGGLVAATAALSTVGVFDGVRGAWRARCRYGLTRHRPVKVITSLRPLHVTPASGLAFAITDQYHRCENCGDQLNESHNEIRELPPE